MYFAKCISKRLLCFVEIFFLRNLTLRNFVKNVYYCPQTNWTLLLPPISKQPTNNMYIKNFLHEFVLKKKWGDMFFFVFKYLRTLFVCLILCIFCFMLEASSSYDFVRLGVCSSVCYNSQLAESLSLLGALSL